MSNRMLNSEIKEQRILGTVLPSIFLAVACFLLNVVLSRQIATQREQIAALKALGYDNWTIGFHYLKLVMIITLLGVVIGVLVGAWVGHWFSGIYADFFRFPELRYRVKPVLIVVATSVSVVAAIAGTLRAIAATVQLAPAEAMRPPSPGVYRPALIERFGLRPWLSTAWRMILRNMERRALRTAVTTFGIAISMAIVVTGAFWRDSINFMIETGFEIALRGDVEVTLIDPMSYIDRRTLNRLLHEDDLVSQVTLAVDRNSEPELLGRLKQLPKVAGALSKAVMLRNMQEVTARNMLVFSAVLTAFACVIAVGVVYNNARIALAERSWELASLRVLGFTRAEVSAFLLGALGLEIILAIPLGIVLGYGLALTIINLIQSDEFYFPLIIGARTYAYAAFSVILAGLVSAMIVRKRIDALDLVAVLKTRE
jgi:ABC-type antimicrobial peptide transport system permease subunit